MDSTTSLRRRRDAAAGRPGFPALAAIALVCLLAPALLPLPIFAVFEGAAYDAMMSVRNAVFPRPLGDRVGLVGISETSETLLGEDLDRRQAHMELLRRLREAGAAGVAFDLFFINEKETDDLLALQLGAGDMPVTLAYHFRREAMALSPPEAFPRDLQPLVAEQARGAFSELDARTRIRQLDSHAREVQDALDRLPGDVDEGTRLELLRRFWLVRELRSRFLSDWFVSAFGIPVPPGCEETPEAGEVRLLAPGPMLAAPALGFANIEKEREQVVRSVPLVYRYRQRLFPQLSLAAVLAYHEVGFDEAEVVPGKAIRFRSRRLDQEGRQVVVPIDRRGEYLVNFREGEAFLNRQPDLVAVLRPDRVGFDPTPAFRDRLVVVGEVITGGAATDVEPIPIQTAFPMVGMHANIIESILEDDHLRRWPWWAKMGVLVLLAVGYAAAFHRLAFGVATAVAGLLAVVYMAGQFLAFARFGVVAEAVTPLLGSGLTVAAFFAYLVVVKDRDRRLVRDVFLKSVSPRIGEEILKNYNDPAIWGARREITVLFLDIRGYTTLTESVAPEKMLALLDRFYDTASAAVFAHEGQVNKFLGDAVLALFGALPEEGSDHAARALRAAAAIQRSLAQDEELRALEAEVGPVATGAGVNTGEATVGLVGRRRIRIEYTALGDPVNVAARLQTLATEGEVMIGESTLRAVGGPGSSLLAQVGLTVGEAVTMKVKGREHPVIAYRGSLENDINGR